MDRNFLNVHMVQWVFQFLQQVKWNICSIRENGLKDLKIPNVLKVYYGEIKAKKVINDDEVYVYPEYESAKEISLKF